MVSTENITRFDLDMDGSMEPSEHGRWVRHEDLVQAIATEREACAKVCESEWSNVAERLYSQDCARVIRARSQP
jgi:hypothetical protein